MKKGLVALGIVLLLVIGAGLFIWLQGEEEPERFVTGEAEAVAVTPVVSFDGLFNPLRVFDALYAPMGITLLGDYIVVADSMCDRVQFLGNGTSRRVGRHGRYGLSYYYAGAFIDGFIETAMFMKPAGVFAAPCGGIIVADTGNHAIRKITGDFVITLAGNGTEGYQNGAEGQARFNRPRGVVMCAEGNIYVADTLNHIIRRIYPNGYVTLFAGAAGQRGFVDGGLTEARFFEPSGLYITDAGVLYIADAANHALRRIENGHVTTLAGQPGAAIHLSDYYHGGFIDGNNAYARFNFPRDITRLPDGSLLVADSLNHAVRLVTPAYTRTLFGGGEAGFFHHSAENLRLTRPEGITTDGYRVFISDTLNNHLVAVPISQRVLKGRPSRGQMLAETGLSVDTRFVFRGDIRVFLGDRRIDMGRVQPWAQGGSIFVPIRPLLEALGSMVVLDETSGILYVRVGDTVTVLNRDRDYFIMRGVMVTTLDELLRLFPFTLEWFPELSLLTVFIPYDLRENDV